MSPTIVTEPAPSIGFLAAAVIVAVSSEVVLFMAFKLLLRLDADCDRKGLYQGLVLRGLIAIPLVVLLLVGWAWIPDASEVIAMLTMAIVALLFSNIGTHGKLIQQ